MQAWVEQVVERIRGFAAAPGADRFFGARHHRYELLPVPEAAVLAFEKRHECRLPEDYRTWLLEAGRGAGPGNGLFEPGTWDTGGGVEKWTGRHFGPLAAPFPYRAAQDQHRGPLPGGLPVCDLGCGMVALLITAPPLMGQIWSDERMARTGLHPEGLDFRGWIETWAQGVEREIADPGKPGEPAPREPDRYLDADAIVGHEAVQRVADTVREKISSSKSRAARFGKLGKFYLRAGKIEFLCGEALNEALVTGELPHDPPLSDAVAAVLDAGPGSALRLEGFLRIWLRRGSVRIAHDYLGRESRVETPPLWAITSLMSS